MSVRRLLPIVFTIVILVTAPLFAGTATSLIPSTAPHGARVVVTGSILDSGLLSIAFANASGATSPAAIVSRAPGVAEVIVPTDAVSGPVTIRAANTVTISLTVAPDPTFVNVATLAASDKAHDIFKSPSAVAVALPTGMLFVADTAHNRVAAVQPNGAVAFTAGIGKPGLADGAPAAAQFKQPQGIAVDNFRQVVYIVDTGNSVIRRMSFDGVVTTFAGSGHDGFGDGSAAQAAFKQPTGLAIAQNGNIYVADTSNSAIRMITPDGVVSTIAGGAHDGFADGPLGEALFKEPQGIAVAPDGTIYVADTKNHAIRKIANGIVSTVAGTGHDGLVDGSGMVAEFKEPSGVAVDDGGNLFVADTKNNVVREITFSGSAATVTTLAGTEKAGSSDGLLSSAQFNQLFGLSSAGPLFLADTKNDGLRIIYQTVHASALYPRRGPIAGANTIRLFGTGFVPGATQVTIGGTVGTVTFVSSTEILVAVPSGNAGSVDITVTTPAGSDTLANAYTYLLPPTISSIDPHKGPIAGGQAVTATGTNFVDGGDTIVTIGGVAAAATVNGVSSMTVTTPPNAAGPAEITVTTPGGTATVTGGYAYFAPPAITGFVPAQGSSGATVTITGQNIDPDASGDQVSFNGVPSNVVSASATQIVTTVPASATTGRIDMTTAGGTATSAIDFVIASIAKIQLTSPALNLTVGQSQQFNAIGTMLSGAVVDLTAKASWVSNSNAVVVTSTGLVTGAAAGAGDVTASFGGFSTTLHVTVAAVNLPPDPASVAPKLDPTVVALFADELTFLFTGPNPIQTGVAAGTISDDRITAIRGRVLAQSGQPLAGVQVTALGHPEYGQTLTRADGMFDFVVNGGGTLNLQFAKSGTITAQRTLTTTWHERTTLKDVVLLAYDSQVTPVAMNASAPQVVQSSVVSDSDGTRRATIIVPSGTSANFTFANGTTSPAQALSIRATELTVGQNGPDAMPATLPPTSGYTYCVELTADEALTAGATGVQFSKPLPVYLDNFLQFPVGMAVPVGAYDRAHGTWTPSDNGLVLKVLAIANGSAQLDINGDGVADSGAALAAAGITAEELQTLATLYAPGQTFWRVPVTHFTPWDFNCGMVAPDDAIAPESVQPQAYWLPAPEGCDACADGTASGASVVNMYAQTLNESIPVAGTPFTLDYDSSRTARTQYSTTVVLTPATIPTSLQRVDLTIDIAGEHLAISFSPAPNLSYKYTWDGKDAFGRPVQGASSAVFSIAYVYAGRYTSTPGAARSFGLVTQHPTSVAKSRGEISVLQNFAVKLGHHDMASSGFGGWTLSAQQHYDGRGQVIYGSAGDQRSSDPTQTNQVAVSTVAGIPYEFGYTSDGAAAVQAKLKSPQFIAVGPDGALFFAENWTTSRVLGFGGFSVIRRVDPTTGLLTTVAGAYNNVYGSGNTSPDGTLAVGSAILANRFSVGGDGSIYFVEGYRVRAIVNGILTTIAGNGTFNYTQAAVKGVPATTISILPSAVAVASDGSAYIADYGRVLRIGTDGLAYTEPLGGTMIDLAVGPDGSLYGATAGGYQSVVYRMDPTGKVTVAAGSEDTTLNLLQDGQPATSGVLGNVQAIAAAADGTILISETGFVSGNVIRAITPDAINHTLIGKFDSGPRYGDPVLEGTFGRATSISQWGIAAGPDGSVYYDDTYLNVIRRTGSIFPPSRRGIGTVIASADGSLAYVFENGRHTRTVDTLTGNTVLTLRYDANGFVDSLTDLDNNVTTIERDATGTPTAIVGPGGQRTVLTVTNGLLTGVADPTGNAYAMSYGTDNLMSLLVDPRKGTHTFQFDASGLLIHDQAPDGFFLNLSRSGTNAQNYTVTVTTSAGRTHYFRVGLAADSTIQREHDAPDGSVLRLGINAATTKTTTTDGSSSASTQTPDPRFGMASPFTSSRTVTAGTLTMTSSATHTVVPSADLLTAASVTSTFTLNGKTWTRAYAGANRTWISSTPTGRKQTSVLDTKGRVASTAILGITPTAMQYNANGQLSVVQQGSRTASFAYDAKLRLASMTDPLNRRVQFTYDDSDRMIAQTLPDGRVIGFSYDANGNLVSVTPPSRPSHTFGFTSSDLIASYTPPSALGSGTTSYSYNADRQLTLISRPGGSSIGLGYDSSGRLSSLAIARGSYAYAYDPTTQLLASLTAPDGGAITYQYNGPLLTTVTSPVGTITFGYDNNFRVTSENVAGNSIAFGYDADGLLTTAGAMTLQNDPDNGRLLSSTLLGSSSTWTYDGFGAFATYTAAAGGSTLFTEQVTRNDAGQIVQKSESIGAESHTYAYAYDPSGRLTSAAEDGLGRTYTYDDNGNRLSNGTNSATYDAQDRLLSYGNTTFTYLASGELSMKTDAFGTATYTYDELGNLLNVALPNGGSVSYTIDAQNRRIGRDGGTIGARRWIYSSPIRIAAELDNEGNLISRFVYATGTNVPDYMVRSGITYRVITDHLGSVRLVIDATTGTIAQRMDYDEFGRILIDTNPGFQPFGFAGGLYDPDTQLVRFGARDYDASVGRWTSRDPIMFAARQANLYQYGFADPVNIADAGGLSGVIKIHSWGALTDEGDLSWKDDADVGHSYIEYTSDSGEHITWGNFGNNPMGRGFGVLVDVELDRGETTLVSDVQRYTWIDDAGEKRMRDMLKQWQAKGYSPAGNCAAVAHDVWQAATGENLHYKYGGVPNPVSLRIGILQANQGARVAAIGFHGVTGWW